MSTTRELVLELRVCVLRVIDVFHGLSVPNESCALGIHMFVDGEFAFVCQKWALAAVLEK